MACGIFLNFEKVSIEIIEKELAHMTDDNLLKYDEGEQEEVNETVFVNNLIHGSTACTFIVNLYETSINTIISRRLNIVSEEILKMSVTAKIHMIASIYGFDIQDIISNNSYAVFKEINKVRNDITHFKNNELCEGHFISDFVTLHMGTGKKPIAEIYTKSYIDKAYKEVLKLISLICKKCGLYVYKDCQIIDCDGRDDLCEFIVSSNPEEREY